MLKISVLILATLTSMVALASPCENHSPEVTLTMSSPQYSEQLQGLKQQHEQNGKTLRIIGCDVLSFEPTYNAIYAYVGLTVGSNELGWKDLGSLVGALHRNQNGQVQLESVFFSPAPEIPGGASVGNL